MRAGYATSTDGSNWTKFAGNPVLKKGPYGSWDAGSVFGINVIDSAGIKYKMWYVGKSEGWNTKVGYAESDNSNTGVEEYVSSGFSIYPNPTNNLITIESTQQGNKSGAFARILSLYITC